MQKLSAAGQSTSQTANIVIVIAFEVDLPAIFETADAEGLLEAPFVWITSDSCVRPPCAPPNPLGAPPAGDNSHECCHGPDQLYSCAK